MSTGTSLSTPGTTEYAVRNGPPPVAQFPIAITHFGSGICSYSVTSLWATFQVTVPFTIIRSHWRGEERGTTPNRSASQRAPNAAANSMAQQARTQWSGKREFRPAQLNTGRIILA